MKFNNPLDDFSVVVQGKVFGKAGNVNEEHLTDKCIKSIRALLPNAEIIISTWEGTDVSYLKCDKVVFSRDPGAIAFSDLYPNHFNNNNRQIVSTCNGLKAATRTYAIKMRGDCMLLNTSFFDYFLKEYPRSTKYRFLKERIVIPTKYSRNPRRIAMLFHPSDLFQMGLLEDLVDLWAIPLQPEPEMTRGVAANKRIINHSLQGNHYRMKMGSEQYLWYAFVKQKGLDLELKYFSQLPVSKIFKAEFSIINNFVIADASQIGVLLPKKIIDDYDDKDLYTHQEWLNLSKKYGRSKISKFEELLLISQVYINNWKMIGRRIIGFIKRRSKRFIKRK